MRIATMSIAFITVLAGMSPGAAAADPGSKPAIQKKLESEYALTKTTDDQSDIVTAGAVLVLQKDKLLMVAATTTGNPCPNTYRDGKFSQSGVCRTGATLKKIPMFGSKIPGADKAPATRTYVTGEKFWVTKIDVNDTGKEPGVVMDFYTDAVSDVRYKTSLKIPFKGSVPSPEDAVKLVSEVVKVAPSDDKEAKGSGQLDKGNAQQAGSQGDQPAQQAAAAEQPAPAAAAAPAEAAPAAIEPPPPPPADPPTVALGQTPDEVVAALGQPVKKAKVGTKEIYFYKDLKVSFVNGKVKDIQ